LTPRTPAEQALAERKGWPETTRLACQARVAPHASGVIEVRRLVRSRLDATLVDMQPRADAVTSSSRAVVMAVRVVGLDDLITDGLVDDLVHVFNRCQTQVSELVEGNGGRLISSQGSTILAAFASGDRGRRSALRAALRIRPRLALLNPHLLRHFGVQAEAAVGLGEGPLVEANALALGTAVSDAHRRSTLARVGAVLAPVTGIPDDVDVFSLPTDATSCEVVDFSNSDIVFLVQSSFDLVLPRADAFVAEFYKRLFRIYPASKPLFEHTDMVRQRQMLKDTLALAIRSLENFDSIKPVLRELGARHVDYGVKLRDYQYVGRALLEALDHVLESDFTPEVEIAWREIYGALVRAMVEH
ncbi:MAG: globin domain-containing protein, partial [Myxococcota bacterium]